MPDTGDVPDAACLLEEALYGDRPPGRDWERRAEAALRALSEPA